MIEPAVPHSTDAPNPGLGECALLCPCCGSGVDLHQRAVMSWFRWHEDGDALCSHHSSSGVEVDRVPSHEAPGRRGTVDIEFNCDQCGIVILRLMQHKGRTLVYWVSSDDACEVVAFGDG